MVFYVKLAEKVIEIHAHYNMIHEKCADYIITPDCNDEIDFVVEAKQDEIMHEEAEMQEDIWRLNGMYFSRDPQLLEFVVIQRKIASYLFENNTLIMHGSVVSLDNHGYMFTGHSGIGKSTRTRMWLQEYPDSFVINGDKPFLRITDNNIYAYGSPWCGKEEWNTNTSAPLRAIFFLERAETNEEMRIEEIGFEQALPLLLQQIYCPPQSNAVLKSIQLLKVFIGKVKLYCFRSAPTFEAIHLAYRTARPE